MDVTTLQLVYGIIGAVLGVIGALAVSKKTSKDEGATAGTIASDLGYVKKGIDEINRKFERLENLYHDLDKRVTAIESSVKQAHKRIDFMVGTPEELHD